MATPDLPQMEGEGKSLLISKTILENNKLLYINNN